MSASPKVFLTASAVAALAAGFVTSPAAAQQLQLRSAAAPHAVSYATVSAVIPTVDDARQLVKDGKWKEARTAYGTIIDNDRVRGDYSRSALEELANLKYMMDDVRGAARAYEELGVQAEIFADPATELDARFKAALLYQETHDKRNVALQMPRIKALLKSPVIAAETKAAIAKKIGA